MQIIYKGDRVCSLLTLTNPGNEPITMVAVQVGKVCKEYAMPSFPLSIGLEEDETAQLEVGTNAIDFAIWDACGKKTSPTTLRVTVKEKKVCGG